MADKLFTTAQLDSAVDGFAAAVTAMNYEEKANLGDLAYLDNVSATEIDTTLSDLLDEKVDEQTLMDKIEEEVGKVYKAAGNATLATIGALTAANEGKVYNMTADFTTTADFVEGAGNEYSAGTDVAIIKVGTAYKYNVLSSYIDSSAFANATEFAEIKDKVDDMEYATQDEITAIINGLSLDPPAPTPSP